MRRTLQVLPWNLGIVRLKNSDEIPGNILEQPFYSVIRTDIELSIVTMIDVAKKLEKESEPWKAIRFKGALDFSLVGVLSEISEVLKDADISIFALSTYDTDYILIRSAQLDRALKCLEENYFIETL